MRSQHAVQWAVGLVCMGIVLVGCDEIDKVEHPTGDAAWEMAHRWDGDPDEIIARVEGQVITAADVEATWRDEPEWTRQEVVEHLVEREVLALEAKKQGYHERPEVSFARKQGMVSALLAEEIEAKAEPDWDQREQRLERVKERRRAPEGLRATHLVILVPDELEDEDGELRSLRKSEREPYFEQAEQYVEEALHRLDGRVDDDALREVARKLNEEILDDDFEAMVNEHMRFPRSGESYDSDHLPDGWVGVVSAFSKGAESVADHDSVGTLSEPVRTRFGWHLIRVMEVIPERPVKEDMANAYVEHQLRTEARQRRLQEQMEEWADGVRIEIFSDRLGSAFDDDEL